MKTDRRSVLTAAVKLAAGTALVAAAPTQSQQRGENAAGEAFALNVRFDTPLTPGLEIAAELSVGQPFTQKLDRPQGGLVAISGMLLPRERKGGKYPLVLTLLDYGADKSHSLGTTLLHLKLEEPVEWGSIQSAVHAYRVTLTRAKRP